MEYQIIDSGASLKILNETGEKLIAKASVVCITIVRVEMIRIELQNPDSIIYLRHSNVSVPITASPNELKEWINSRITACLCCNCESRQPGTVK